MARHNAAGLAHGGHRLLSFGACLGAARSEDRLDPIGVLGELSAAFACGAERFLEQFKQAFLDVSFAASYGLIYS